MSVIIRRSVVVILILLIVLTATACKAKENTQNANDETRSVEVIRLENKTQRLTSELSGMLEPLEEVTVSFETGGRITSLPLKEGDPVQLGKVVAQIDTTDYSLELDSTASVITQQQAGLGKALSNYEKTKLDFERVQVLYQEGAVSQSEYDRAQNLLTAAEKDLEQVRALYEQSVIRSEKTSVLLEKTKLKAPINGMIISKVATLGQLVSAGTPIYRIGNIDQLKVILPVSDREISQWQVGEKISLELYDQKRSGVVKYIYPAANQNTGTIGVELWVDNPGHKWFAGQVVKATHTIKEKKALWVPVKAVISPGSEKPCVFILEENKAVKKPVSIGELINDQYEITAGISKGDMLITSSVDRLFDEEPVVPLGGNSND